MSHASLAATAERLIKKNGRAAKIRVITGGGKKWDPVPSTADTDVVVCQTKFTKEQSAIWNVQYTDKAFLIAGSVTIQIGNRLVDEGKDYQIVNLEQIKPGTVSILYKVQARL